MVKLLIAANYFLDIPLDEYHPVARRIRRQELLERLNLLLEEALREKTDGVIIAGNLFYRSYPSPTVWGILNNVATKLAEYNISLVVLEGAEDQGPLYQETNTGFFVLTHGQTAELAPGLMVSVGSDPSLQGIVLWRGETPPPSRTDGVLYLIQGNEWDVSESSRIVVGAPYRRDFSGPTEPAFARVAWENGPVSMELVPIQDRMYATVRWDIDEKGDDIAAYLLERQDANLSLRLILTGKIEKPLPIDTWQHQFASGYFLLVIEDQTTIVPMAEGSPLAGDEFQRRMANRWLQNADSAEENQRIKAAWILGLEALKGGSQSED